MNRPANSRGYTLIELVVAVGLFALVMTLSAGAYLLMVDLSRQAQGISTGIDNLSFVLETMTRSIRTGTSYSCGSLGGDCVSGADRFSFKDASGVDITYAYGVQTDGVTGAIAKNDNVILTDPSVSVSALTFYVSGTGTVAASDFTQPYVTIVVSGTVSSGPRKTPQAFTVETSATMRGIDLNIASAPSANVPLPTCLLSASPSSILAGGGTRLSWSNTNAFSFSIDNGVGVGSPAGGGELDNDVFPSITTTYTGTVKNSLGDSSTCTATVTVTSNGSCAATHNSCITGTPGSIGETSTTYTWSCIGDNSGTTASCSELKTPMSLTGYAWSSNTGWISFQGPGYGVTENKTTGALSGYAWSSNIGWISFNASNADATHVAPTVNLTTENVNVSGWARACAAFVDKNACSGALDENSGGWDGWIALSGTAIDGTPYGITQSPTCAWSGYAWGSEVIGAISMSGTANDTSQYGVTGDDPIACSGQILPTATLSASPNPVAYGDRATLTWSSTNATSCTPSANWSNGGTLSGSGLTYPLTADTIFTFQCTGPTGTSALQSVTVTVNLPP